MNLLETLKADEGSVIKAGRHMVYQDSLGLETVGYGRLLSRGLSQDEAEYLLENDIKDAESEAGKYPWYGDLDEVRQGIIAAMIFNMGPVRFAGFHNMLAAIGQGDWVTASNEALNSKWAQQVGARAKRYATGLLTGAL
jgi:lysozyme